MLDHTGGCESNDRDMSFALKQRQGRKYDKTVLDAISGCQEQTNEIWVYRHNNQIGY